VIEMVRYQIIRELHYNQGKSKRAIAQELGVHRNTVTRALENPDQEYRRALPVKSPVNDPFQEKIKKMVLENSKKPRDEKLTKTRMHEILCEDKYPGSYSTFTYLVRKIEEELELNIPETFIKLNPIKGTMQVDFGETYVIKGTKKKKIFFFAAKLCHGKGEFVKAYPLQRREFFFDGLLSAFDFFKGVPKRIIFDNLTQAVKKVLSGPDRITQVEFKKFQSHFNFEAVFCGVGKGNEKGRTENLVKYIKNNYLLPLLDFEGFDKLNDYLFNKCKARMETAKFMGRYWAELMLEEKFLPLEKSYENCRIKEVKVNTYQLVTVERNKYSVPAKYAKKKLLAKIYPFEIVLIYNDMVVATHERCFGRGKEKLCPYHFLPVLRKKVRAYDEAKFIQDWKLPSIFENFHHQLKARRENVQKGTREFIDILRLTEEYSVSRIAKILKELDENGRYSYQDVLSILRYQQQSSYQPKPLSQGILENLDISSFEISSTSLAAYDDLIRGEVER